MLTSSKIVEVIRHIKNSKNEDDVLQLLKQEFGDMTLLGLLGTVTLSDMFLIIKELKE